MNFISIAAALDNLLWPVEETKQRQKRERILLAATDLFIRRGYRKTSIDEVARAAGIAKGTVYLYYGNKAELLYHAVALEKRRNIERLAPAMDASLTPVERLRNFIALNVIMSRELPLTTSLVQGDHEIDLAFREMDDATLKNINARQVAVISALLGEASDDASSRADLKVRTQVLLDLLAQAMTSGRRHAQGVSLERYAWILANAVVDGVVKRPADDIPSHLRSRVSQRSPRLREGSSGVS